MKKQQGFTLIEVLVYLALFAIIIGGVMASVFGIVSGSNRNQTRIIIQQEGEFLMGKINWALIGASSITVNSATQITVNKYNFGSNPIVFDLNSNKLRLKQGPLGIAADLNSDNVKVTSLTFTDIPAAGAKPQGLKTTINLQSITASGATMNQVFETTKYLRK